ncbi:DUF3768 domain-containing protein [Bosea caraganae]|uniref:DUF3768 domain-containing protein n=1 Tax=Bosea caraganae TaxID=2763117 RepID=A0A370L398_9HYPH|nr:DUF3768 domain-containing protein [Bosea caraganae]RDJ22828.1 DUF3768 domain-containing protein [Bosea caraganae]RDJ28607.1 DUF3768 domain-containing protein [Bosea caraganae]
MTAAVRALGRIAQREILRRVRSFADFNEANDPFGEHDFGAFNANGERLFFKVDYFNLNMTTGSKDPADPAITARVLTIMCAGDW